MKTTGMAGLALAIAACLSCSAGELKTKSEAVAPPRMEDGPRPPKPDDLVVYLTGDPADAPNKAVGGPALLIIGGGREVPETYAARALPVANGGDIVVIRASGSDGYNSFFDELVEGPLKPHSVETIMLDSPEKANSDYAVWALKNAEMIWMAGGDQSRYLNAWKGTRSHKAIEEAYAGGALLGGTSAGLAVIGEFIYDPDETSSAAGEDSILNPYDERINISGDFLNLPLLRGYITDSHFRNRDRMGRSLAFMARLRQEGRTETITNIAISEKTSLFIDKDGQGVVDGLQEVYILAEDEQTRRVQVEPGKPLVYTGVLRTKLVAGDTFHLLTRKSSKEPLRLNIDGTTAPPYIEPANFYD